MLIIAEQTHGKKYAKWKCATRVEKEQSVYDVDAIIEKEIHNAVFRAIKKTLGGRGICWKNCSRIILR